MICVVSWSPRRGATIAMLSVLLSQAVLPRRVLALSWACVRSASKVHKSTKPARVPQALDERLIACIVVLFIGVLS